jgi:hypothetical protein
MAFVQGTGLTANQLYVGISGGSPVWVGAQIGTTGSWTDNAAKTSLATQFAIDQRITSQISSSNVITTAQDNTNATKFLVFTSGAGAGVTLGVDSVTNALSYNPSSGELILGGNLTINGDIVSGVGKAVGDIFATGTAKLNIGLAASGITMGGTTGSIALRNPTLILGTTAATITTSGGTANNINITPYGNLLLQPKTTAVGFGSSTPSLVLGNSVNADSFVTVSGADLLLATKFNGISTSPVNIIFEGTTDDANKTTLTVVDPTANRTISLPNASDTLVGKATTDTFTNKTYDTGNTGNVFRINGVTLSAVTGTGSVVLATSPTLVTPNLGVASATTINKVTLTAPATGSTITVANGKTLTASNTLTFTGTDSSSVAFGTGGTVLYTSNLGTNVATFLATPTSANLASALTDETGTGGVVFANSPTLVTPNLGTPSTLVGTNITGTATGLTAGRVLTNANLTGAITSVGNTASLGSFSSANLISALTDETGSGVAVFGTSPTITTSLVSGSTGFDLVNTTATTVNFAGAATTLNMGVLGGTATFAGALTVSGNLTVNGTTTTLNSTTLTVDDRNIEMAAIGVPDDATANGGGIIIKGTTDKTILWDSANSNLTSNQDWNLPTGKVFKINNVSVLSSSALGSGVTGSSLTQVGTITSGTWSGSFGAVSGANLTVLTAGGLTGTIPSGVLGNSSLNIGTTSIALNRTSGSQTLTGVSIDGTAGTATNVTVASETSDTTCFVTFVTADTGNLPTKVNSTLTYNAVSGELSATLIDGGSF